MLNEETALKIKNLVQQAIQVINDERMEIISFELCIQELQRIQNELDEFKGAE